jgi:energy-coupling factor transporter ATP-binding protein EcfA2
LRNQTTRDNSYTPFVGCSDVSVQFYDRDRPVLNAIDLSIEKNESVLLLGPSGCGKSTLSQVLSGIIPHSIEALMSGQVWRPDRVGVLFQDPDTQFCMMTVEDEIAFSLENLQVEPSQMKGIIEHSLGQVGLNVPLAHPISSLSGGMKQRLAMATILALEPEALFFDEPTAQLDPQGTIEMVNLMRSFHGKKTMITIEHKLDGVIEWMDRVVLFTPDGHILDQGAPDIMFRSYQKEIKAYGIWQPRLWPLRWEEIEQDTAHPIHKKALDIQKKQKEDALLRGLDSAAKAPLLKISDAALKYPKSEQPVWKDVNISVSEGEWIAILGANGSGKSSFLRMLIGLHSLQAGSIELNGKPLSAYSATELSEWIGFVFQNPEHQFIADTVFKEVAFGGRLAGWSDSKIQEETARLLKDFRLDEMRDVNPFSLSQGQKRRLSVAGTLLKKQPILLLDEPTFGQDAITSYELMHRLSLQHQQGTSIIMATHDVEIVEQYADRVLIFGEGALIYDGTTKGLFSSPSLLQRARLAEPLSYELIRRWNANHPIVRRKEEGHVS